ncbi:MAG: bestrophin family protein [Bordetella sp.]|uniref:bestrophin family protein n=1 Tax=Bordetella sp. TaxID=28081 RepID=UPI003F7C4C18
MIVRPRPGILGLFYIMRGSIVPLIAGRLIVILLLSCAVAWLHQRGWFAGTHLNAVPFSLFGLALSVFLGFRNNICYDRWWEARKQWGELLYLMRNLARESQAALAAEPALHATLTRRCIGFAHALLARLRAEDETAAARPWVDADEGRALGERANVSDALLRAINADLADALRRGLLSDIVYQGLLQHVAHCAAVQAACERIHNTPAPFAYSLLLHRTAWLFCLLLPFGLVGALGLFMPLVVIIVAYTFFGLDALGDELQEPFGLSDNSLPLRAIVRTIEIDLLDGLGVRPLPPSLTSRDYVLR